MSAISMGRPLFLEGEAGVGKTEIAKVLAEALGRRLIRLQCYEGLDVNAAVYEWNYSAQMIEIRLAEAAGDLDRDRLGQDIFSEKFLTKRPLLQALEAPKGAAPVLLIDELDRTDEAFEAFLLEVLSDFQVTIPELGTVKAEEPPIVVITSNRTREVHAEYDVRLKKIRTEMARRGLDLLIVNDVANQHYITAYDGWSFYTPQMVLVPIEEDAEPVWIGRAML